MKWHSIWKAHKRSRGLRYQPKGTFSWRYLKFWKTEYWKTLQEFLEERKLLGYEIYPSNKTKIFRSLLETPFSEVKIVIVGQDPYYTKGVADGLAFSVLPNFTQFKPSRKGSTGKWFETEPKIKHKIPPSLRNIFKEYREDLKYPYPRTGDLSTWARNGILIFNTVWTVEQGKPKSHYRIRGKQLWQELSTEIIEQLSKRKDRLVFILWGKVAQEYSYVIDEKKHLVLKGAHPSPRNMSLTAKDGIPFNGGRYFSKACDYLGIPYSIWRLP